MTKAKPQQIVSKFAGFRKIKPPSPDEWEVCKKNSEWEIELYNQRTQILNEVRRVVEGMKTEECFCDNCYSLTVIKGKPTRSEHCTNQGRDGIIDDLLQAIKKLKEEHENKNLS